MKEVSHFTPIKEQLYLLPKFFYHALNSDSPQTLPFRLLYNSAHSTYSLFELDDNETLENIIKGRFYKVGIADVLSLLGAVAVLQPAVQATGYAIEKGLSNYFLATASAAAMYQLMPSSEVWLTSTLISGSIAGMFGILNKVGALSSFNYVPTISLAAGGAYLLYKNSRTLFSADNALFTTALIPVSIAGAISVLNKAEILTGLDYLPAISFAAGSAYNIYQTSKSLLSDNRWRNIRASEVGVLVASTSILAASVSALTIPMLAAYIPSLSGVAASSTLLSAARFFVESPAFNMIRQVNTVVSLSKIAYSSIKQIMNVDNIKDIAFSIIHGEMDIKTLAITAAIGATLISETSADLPAGVYNCLTALSSLPYALSSISPHPLVAPAALLALSYYAYKKFGLEDKASLIYDVFRNPGAAQPQGYSFKKDLLISLGLGGGLGASILLGLMPMPALTIPLSILSIHCYLSYARPAGVVYYQQNGAGNASYFSMLMQVFSQDMALRKGIVPQTLAAASIAATLATVGAISFLPTPIAIVATAATALISVPTVANLLLEKEESPHIKNSQKLRSISKEIMRDIKDAKELVEANIQHLPNGSRAKANQRDFLNQLKDLERYLEDIKPTLTHLKNTRFKDEINVNQAAYRTALECCEELYRTQSMNVNFTNMPNQVNKSSLDNKIAAFLKTFVETAENIGVGGVARNDLEARGVVIPR